MKVLTRIRTWLDRDAVEKAELSALAHDAADRDRIEEEAEGVKMDRFVMSGNGTVQPLLSLGSSDELSEVFERDTHAPHEEGS